MPTRFCWSQSQKTGNKKFRSQLSHYPPQKFLIDQIIQKPQHVARKLYAIWQNKNFNQQEKLTVKWSRDITFQADNIILDAFTSTKFLLPAKMKTFNLKFLHRILPTNAYLHTIQISDTSQCQFCLHSRETYFHLFWNCPKSQIVWKTIQNLLSFILNKSLSFTSKNWLLHEFPDNKAAFSNIATIIKMYIFSCKYSNSIPDSITCWYKIKNTIHTEWLIYKNKDKITKFQKKWGAFSSLRVNSTH